MKNCEWINHRVYIFSQIEAIADHCDTATVGGISAEDREKLIDLLKDAQHMLVLIADDIKAAPYPSRDED